MNVIISNKFTDLLKTLEIEVIKRMEGTYEVDEIVQTFSNFYFNKMILDITAINGYEDISVLQKLAIDLDANKIILVLDNDNTIINNVYLSKLVSIGFYNFARNLENIKYLYEHPNTYRDVAHIQSLEAFPNNDNANDGFIEPENIGKKIIGIRNLNEHAGSTSFIYMMKKMLSNNFSVIAFEIDRRDFSFLPYDKNLISTTETELPKLILSHNEANIILVDLNGYPDDKVCNEVLYLIDPGLIKVNKMIKRDSNIFSKYKTSKIILNRSALTPEQISNFEYEAKVNFFFNMPNIEMRVEENENMYELLNKLGFVYKNE